MIEYYYGSSPLLDSFGFYVGHKLGLKCPYCNYNLHLNEYEFEEEPNLLQVIFNPRVVYFKKESVVVVSLCPHCKEVCWCHRNIHEMIKVVSISNSKRFAPDLLERLKAERLK